MSICEIVLSVNFELIIALILAIATLFGAPYIVKAQNKRELDKKVELTEFIDLRNTVGTKADTDYVKEQIRSVHHRIDEEDKHKMLILNQMQEAQNIIQKDIKEILRTMPRK